MKRTRQCTWTTSATLAAAIAAVLLGCTFASAAPPPGKGGGGGEGGDGTSARFSVVELPLEGKAVAISDPDASGVVIIAIQSSEAGYGSAAYALVDRNTKTVLTSAFLPEPPYVDPNDGVTKNGWSDAADVNVAGGIVGVVPDPDNSTYRRATFWFRDGAAYDFEVLPLLAGHSDSFASGINNWGDMVGASGLDGNINSSVAVMWDAETHTAVDLNTQTTAAQGWQLVAAWDINDAGLIAGNGYLDGAWRGYLLDPLTESIWAIPLIGPATGSVACRINASGRVAGYVFDGEEIYYGTDPDYVQAFSWDGPGTAPVVLPSVTDNTSHAFNLNDFGATVGNSYIQTDDLFALDSVPTLWEFDEEGNVVATDLASAIPSKPSYTLNRAGGINNDGWIGVSSRKFEKGKYRYPALLLIANN